MRMHNLAREFSEQAVGVSAHAAILAAPERMKTGAGLFMMIIPRGPYAEDCLVP